MKFSFITFSLFLSIVIMAEPYAQSLSSFYINCSKKELKSHCELESKNNCESDKSDKSKTCNNTDNCAMVCCVSVFYYIQNKKIFKTFLKEKTEKEIIFSKPDLFTNGYKSNLFHPPNVV